MKKNSQFTLIRGIAMLLMLGFAFGSVCAQNVEIKDSDDNLLMKFNDEGATGSISIFPGAEPESTTNKLYNTEGELKWNGTSMISPLWLQNGSALYYNSGKVGIGVSSPTADLHVSGIGGALFTGTYFSGVIPVEGAGTRMMWYPGKSAFRVGTVDGTEWDDANIGIYSLALGYNSKASSASSTAIGLNTLASGASGLAVGEGTIASGWIATAMGYSTIASGNYSLSAGFGIEASGEYSVAIGLNNQNGTVVSQANTMAIMGGRVGVGTVSPVADLQVEGEKGVVFSGTIGNGTVPLEGAGTRMMWYPGKAAFRAGRTNGSQWNDLQIGLYSMAMGMNAVASGDYSVAFGTSAVADADHSVAIGNDSQTTGSNSVAIGQFCESSGINSVALGMGCLTSGNYALATNYYTEASGTYAVSMGYSTTASGMYSMALGNGIDVSGTNSVGLALDNESGTTVSQDNTMAIMGGNVGIGITNPLRKLEVVDNVSSYVAMIKNSDVTGCDGLRVVLGPENPGSGNRFVEFLANGGSYYPGYICGDGAGGVNYTTASDRRLKRNIEDYNGGLEKVKEIRVKQYEMKSAPGKEKVGFIAQELQKIYPQAVSGDPNGNVDEEPMGVDYGQLTPLLVSAIQEQQKKIERQQKMIEDMQKEIDLLKEELSEQ